MTEKHSASPKPPSPATKTVTTYIVIGVALVALAVVLWRITDVFVVAFGGVVFAVLLRALSAWVARWTHLRASWSLGVTVLALAVLVALVGWMFGSLATNQVSQLSRRLPEAAGKVMDWAQQYQGGRMLVDALKRSAMDSQTLSGVGLAAGALVNGLADVLLVFFLSIYFALDPETYRAGLLRLLPPARRPQVRRAIDDAGEALQQWLLAQAIAMLLVGVLTGVGLAIVGVPLAFALGLIAGLLEFIPVAGPVLSAIPGLLLAFTGGPEAVAWALAVYVVVQQLESNVIAPLLQRWAVSLPPVVGLLAVVACAFLFGAMGIIFATPIAVVVMAMVRHLYVEDALESGTPEPSASTRKPRRAAA